MHMSVTEKCVSMISDARGERVRSIVALLDIRDNKSFLLALLNCLD